MKLKNIIGLLCLAVFIAGCNIPGKTTSVSTGEIEAEEILKLDPDADIFQFDGVMYQTNIQWVEELTVTKDVQVGKIKALNNSNTEFKDDMANKLPVGAIIFSIKERKDILLVEYKGEMKKYLAIVEG